MQQVSAFKKQSTKLAFENAIKAQINKRSPLSPTLESGDDID